MVKIRPLESSDFLQTHSLILEVKHVLDDSKVFEARFSDFCSSDAHSLLGAELEGVLVG